MFTVLSNTRNSNLYLIVGLATLLIVTLTFVVAPPTATPKPALVPMTGISEYPDYYQRHPELRVPEGIAIDTTDYFVRHPEWASNVQNSAIPVTSNFESSDYFQRHPELSASAETAVDMTDYFTRHPELRVPTKSKDLSDYFLRH